MGGAFSGDRYINALFRNPGNDNRWLKLKLVGNRSNRSAYGVRIHLRIKTPDGPRSIYKTVRTGSSFGGNPTRQEIGLGDAESIESLTVYWPTSRTKQVFNNMELNHAYRINEDSNSLEPIQYPKLIPRESPAHRHNHH
jgi:hypothetical protein